MVDNIALVITQVATAWKMSWFNFQLRCPQIDRRVGGGQRVTVGHMWLGQNIWVWFRRRKGRSNKPQEGAISTRRVKLVG